MVISFESYCMECTYTHALPSLLTLTLALTLTYDFDFQSAASYGHDPTHF